MQLIRLKLAWSFLFLILIKKVDGGTRPESLLKELLTKPFMPTQFASPNCIRDSEFYLNALNTYTPWALKMYDASEKIPPGLITGNIRQLGNFDECLQVDSDHGFTGQACYADIEFDIMADNTSRHDLDLGDLLINVATASNATKWTSGKTVPYQWMWCVPSTCKHSEIQEALEMAFDHLKVDGRVDFEVTVYKEACYTVDFIRTNNTLDISDYLFIMVFAVCTMFCIVSTLVRKYMKTQLKKSILANDLTKALCLYTNGKNLLSTEKKDDSIGCIHGLRFWYICWIVYGHAYYMETTKAIINLSEIPHMHYDWKNMLILNANIATDIFFLLSGILSSYTELKKMEQMDDINWNLCDAIKICYTRYIRLTPPYAMMIFFYSTLFRFFGMGPRWHSSVHLNNEWCRKNWWTNLLYINNFVNMAEMCMSQSWYLAVDMQFHLLIAPFIRYMIYKLSRFKFYIGACCLLFLSILIAFFITFSSNLTGTMLYYKNQQDLANYFLEIYIKPYARFGPYIVGTILGFFIYQTVKMHKIKLPLLGKIFGWMFFISIIGWCIFYPNIMYYDTHEYNKWEASIYAALHRPLLSIAISWVIFCCVNGYAGPLNHFLSWRGFIPLSKLTYGIYLVHYVYLLSRVGAARTPDNLTRMDVLAETIVTLAYSISMAVVLTLVFEMPCINIYRLFSFRERRISKNEPTITTNKQNGDITKSEEPPISATLPIQNAETSPSNEEMSTNNVNFNELPIMCKNNNNEQYDLNVSNDSNISEYIDCSDIIDENHENVIERV